MGHYFNIYYVSRALAALACILTIAAIIVGIIAIWSDGGNSDKLGATAGVLCGGAFLSGFVGALAMLDTRKPYREPKDRKDQF